MQRINPCNGRAYMKKRWALLIVPVGAVIAGGWFAARAVTDTQSVAKRDGERAAVSDAAGSELPITSGAAFDRKRFEGKKTVEARYIERESDPLYARALEWMADEKEMRAAFFESHDPRDRSARDELNALTRAEKLKRFDMNGDGELDEFEAEIMNRPRFEQSIAGQKTLDRFDVNRDMRIDPEEREALDAHYRSEIRLKLEALLPKYDQDGDGRLSSEERAVYQMDEITRAVSPTEAELDKDAQHVIWLTYRLDMNGDMWVGMEDTRLFLHHLARGSVIADLDRDGLVGLNDYDTHRDWSFEFEQLLAVSP